MEMIDVMTEDGSPTGIVKTRKEVHTTGLWHKTVHIWMINSEGEVLMQQRSPQKDSSPNKWDMTAAGHISAGMTSLETAKQELWEEVGIQVEPNEFTYLFSVKESSDKDGMLKRHLQDVYIIYKDVLLEEIKVQTEEVSKVQWMYFTEMENWIARSPQDFCNHTEEYVAIFALLHKKFGV